MTRITTIGIDLAKKVFQVHGVDAEGKIVVARKLRRKDVLAFIAKLPPCLVGMEACGSAHYWRREIAKLGHTVKLMPPKYVKAYVKRGKTDAIDAAAICEAVTRPSMSFVPVKGIEQQVYGQRIRTAPEPVLYGSSSLLGRQVGVSGSKAASATSSISQSRRAGSRDQSSGVEPWACDHAAS
jgi:transposase